MLKLILKFTFFGFYNFFFFTTTALTVSKAAAALRCSARAAVDYEKDLISGSHTELILSCVSTLEICFKSLTN